MPLEELTNAAKPASVSTPSVSTKRISPPSACVIVTLFCESTEALTLSMLAALIAPARSDASVVVPV